MNNQDSIPLARREHVDEMHRSIGHALARWQYVETGLYLVTHCLMGTTHELSSTAFFHIESARSKVSLTDKLCLRCLKQDTYQRHWLPLKKEIGCAVDIRNALAHFELSAIDPTTTKRDDGKLTKYGVILSPNAHNESAVRTDGAVRALCVEDLHASAQWFLNIARGLLEFLPAHVPDWQERTETLPQRTCNLLAAIRSEVKR